MDLASRQKLEYEEQAFGISSNVILSAYKSFLIKEIQTTLRAMTHVFEKQLVPCALNPELLRAKLKQVTDDMEKKYTEGINVAIKANEAKIYRCFELPEDFLLEEDSVVRTVEGLNIVEEKAQVEELRQKLCSVKYQRGILLDELEAAKRTVRILQNIVQKTTKNINEFDDIMANFDEAEKKMNLREKFADNIGMEVVNLTIED